MSPILIFKKRKTHNKIYLIIERSSKTDYEAQNFISSEADENHILSYENSYFYNLTLTNKKYALFSLDDHIVLSRDNEIITSSNLLDLSKETQTTISFKKKYGAGVFDNFMCFTSIPLKQKL